MEFTFMGRAFISHLAKKQLAEAEKFLSEKGDTLEAYFVREETIPTLKSILAKL